MSKENSKININFKQLGQSFRTYGIASLIVAVIVFCASFFTILGSISSIYTIQGLISFTETMKGVLIATMILSLIETLFLAYLINTIRQSAAKGGRFSQSLQRVFIFLGLSMITQIGLAIVGSIVGFQALDQIILDIGTMSLAELEVMASQVDSTSIIVNILNLIPLGLSLVGYMSLKNFGDEISLTLARSEPSNEIMRGCKYLSYAAIIGIVLGFLELIPVEILTLLTGAGAIAQLLLFYLGLFKTGRGLIEIYPQVSMNIPSGPYTSEKRIYNISRDTDISFKTCISCGAIQQSGDFCGKCGSKL